MARKVRVIALAILVASALPLLIPSPTAEAGGVLQTYMTGLDWPVAMAFASDGRIFFAERLTGAIRIILHGTLSSSPYYHLPDTVSTAEDGLLGLALAPGFPADPWVYAYQSYDDVVNATVYNRIVRIRDAGGTGVSFEVLLDRIPHEVIHNGGPMAFGPDGKLYVLVGDGQKVGEILTSSQDLLSPSGKVLRLNADGTVPTDNPFYGNPSVNPYIYTYGHRSPFGLAFHPMTGKLFITENGPECNDEVDLLIPGRNYGWGRTETCSSPPPPPYNTNQDGPDPVLPLIWYTPVIAPTNAIIYGGLNFTEFRGDMIMGDFNTGSLRHLDLEEPNYDRVVSQSIILTVPEGILEVEQGLDGAIWFTTRTTIYRLVDPAHRPRASFTATPNPVDIGVPVTFDASASSDPDGTIVSYTWDFGDGSRGGGVQTVHVYPSSATYTVALTVVDNASLSATAVGRIQVGTPTGAPFAAFSVSSAAPVVGESVFFDGSASFDPDGSIVSHAWNFGDGATATGITTAHAYRALGTYSVALTVVDDAGFSDTAPWQVRVNGPPLAGFLASASLGYIGVPITFDAGPSSDPDDAIVSYSWDFGDGTFASSVSVTHAYANKGTFEVTLTVTDEFGAVARRTESVIIANRGPAIVSSSPLVASVTIGSGERLTFSVDATDPDGDPLTYSWSVNGHAAGDNARSFEFTEEASGTYAVNVTLSDGSVAASREWTVTVLAPTGLPSWLLWLSLGGILAVAIAGIVTALSLRRIRRKKRVGESRN